MTRRTAGRPEKLRLPPAAPPEEPLAAELTDRQAEAYDTFAGILEGLGEQEGHIKINRRGKSGGMEFCERVPATPDFDEEYVRRSWGGGVYSIQMFGPDPEKPGRTKYLTSVTFYITGAPRDKKAEDDGATTVTPPGGVSGESLELRLRLASLEGMLAGMSKGSGGSGDHGNPLDNLEKLTTIVKNLMPAPVAAGGMGAGEVFGIVRDVIGLSKEMAPESSEGTPWGMIIDKAVEPAIGLIGQALAAQKAGSLPPGTIPPTIVASTDVQIPSMTGAPMWQVELAKIVPKLLARARAGKDPTLAADLFLEDAPGGALEQLRAFAADGNFVATVLALAEQNFPEVGPVREWVAEFLAAVRDGLLEGHADPSAPTLTVETGKKEDDDDAAADR